MERQPEGLEKMLKGHVFVKELVAGTMSNLNIIIITSVNNFKDTNNPMEKCTEDFNRHLTKGTAKWLIRRESCSDSQAAEKYKIIVTIRYHYTRVRAAKTKMTKY